MSQPRRLLGTIILVILLYLPSSAVETVFVEDFITGHGLDVSEFGYTLQDFQIVPNDPFTIPKVMALLNDPLLIPEYLNAGGEYYLENQNKIGNLIRKCAKDSGSYLWRDQPPLAESDDENPFDLFPPGQDIPGWQKGLDQMLENVGEDERKLWIRLFAACTQFIDCREEALRNIPREKWESIRANAVEFMLSDDFYPDIYDACLNFDFDSMYRGALMLADAFDALREGVTIDAMQANLMPGQYTTPLGIIRINDSGSVDSDELNSEEIFLLIDLGVVTNLRTYFEDSTDAL